MRKPGNELFLARKSSSKKRHIVSIEKNNIDKYIRQLVSARTREKPFSFLVTNLKRTKKFYFFGGAESSAFVPKKSACGKEKQKFRKNFSESRERKRLTNSK